MQNWKKIALYILWSLLGVALIVLFVFAWQAKSIKKCKDIDVELVGENPTALFMNEQEILRILNEQQVKIGTPINALNLALIEGSLEKTAWIKNAELYFDNQLVLRVRIEQRLPIARVFTVSGQSFYVDKQANQLPLRQLSVLRLPVFTGFTSDQSILSKPDSILLENIVQFASVIKEDSFFSAQIAQINIAPNGDFELTPTLGDHTVLLGSIDQLENKLDRLYTFYKKIWVPSGINAYQVLDLRFNHQIVTLKKGLQPIQFNGPLMLLGSAIMVNDTTSSAQPSVPILKDSIIKPVPVKDSIVVKKALPKAVKKPQTLSKKIVKPSPKKIKTKSNNKPNNKSLNNVKKSAKAVMPKKG
jgi:cell division protein FtsQ